MTINHPKAATRLGAGRLAHDPGARLRGIAAALGITERSAYGIVTDLDLVAVPATVPSP